MKDKEITSVIIDKNISLQVCSRNKLLFFKLIINNNNCFTKYEIFYKDIILLENIYYYLSILNYEVNKYEGSIITNSFELREIKFFNKNIFCFLIKLPNKYLVLGLENNNVISFYLSYIEYKLYLETIQDENSTQYDYDLINSMMEYKKMIYKKKRKIVVKNKKED